VCPDGGFTDCQERGNGDWSLQHLESYNFVEGSNYNLIVQNSACEATTYTGLNFDSDGWSYTYTAGGPYSIYMTNAFEGYVYSLKVVGESCWVSIENNSGDYSREFGKGEYNF
jgi:hypothetical protein